MESIPHVQQINFKMPPWNAFLKVYAVSNVINILILINTTQTNQFFALALVLFVHTINHQVC